MSRDEMALKRRMIESMEQTDKTISSSLDKMAKTMDTFAQSMSMLANAVAYNTQQRNSNFVQPTYSEQLSYVDDAQRTFANLP